MNQTNKSYIPIQSSIRLQVIQKQSAETSSKPGTSRQMLSRLLEKHMFKPVLTKRISSPLKPFSKSKDPPLNELSTTRNFSIFRLHSTSSRDFYKSRQKQVSISESFEQIASPIQVPSAFKPPSQVTCMKKLKSSSKLKQNNEKVSCKADIDKLWRRVFYLSNGIECNSAGLYKVFIGKGNNSGLVRRIMASRIWWKLTDDVDEAHFVWTQWKDMRIIEKSGKFNEEILVKADQKLPPWPVVGKNFWPKAKIPDPEYFGLNLIQKSQSFRQLGTRVVDSNSSFLYNKFEFNQCLTDKGRLLATMKNFYTKLGLNVFERLPLTFHINSKSDPEYEKFLKVFQELELNKENDGRANIWIVKPGENSNRGNGVHILNSIDSISPFIPQGEGQTLIIQKYIENPFLINKRKFDIRCYAMLTSINGVIQGYFYQDGYLRTSSQEFSLENISNNFIHLTNDAIQKYSQEYGKYENANKLSYKDFQRYLDLHLQDLNFYKTILPQIREIVKETILASFSKIDSNRRLNSFEILGYDFMLDKDLKPWLIEVNTNPCLELSSLNLRIIIPSMIENAIKIVVDSLFPPPGVQHLELIQVNKFELIFHSENEGRALALL